MQQLMQYCLILQGETDQPAVTRPGPGSQVKEQRPNSTQYIRNYCRRRTTIFHHDFNARALRKRQERLQNNGALMQAIPKQVMPLNFVCNDTNA